MHDDDAYSRDRREIGYGSVEEIQPVLDRLAATAPESLSPPVCIETFISLDGTKATIDLRGAELWDGGDDEWLVRVGARFVLMHPDRPSREIEPEAATHWFRHHFGAQPLPDGFPPISRETPSLATWWRGEGLGVDADPAPGADSTPAAPAAVPTAWDVPEAEGSRQPVSESPADRPPAEPPAATAPGPAARPTHEIERRPEPLTDPQPPTEAMPPALGTQPRLEVTAAVPTETDPTEARERQPEAPAPAPAAGKPDGEPEANTVKATNEKQLPKEPSEKAIQCYRMKMITGEETTQKKIAAKVYGDMKKQYQVSRDLKEVKAWIEAGNILPDLDPARPKVVSMDPRKLEQGPRRDGRR